MMENLKNYKVLRYIAALAFGYEAYITFTQYSPNGAIGTLIFALCEALITLACVISKPSIMVLGCLYPVYRRIAALAQLMTWIDVSEPWQKMYFIYFIFVLCYFFFILFDGIYAMIYERNKTEKNLQKLIIIGSIAAGCCIVQLYAFAMNVHLHYDLELMDCISPLRDISNIVAPLLFALSYKTTETKQ